MEVGTRIKSCRADTGISQDDLAARIYVSRQTISSWENSKTYPDVQSLLLLSEIFGVTVDSLIKGDVEAMEKKIDSDVCTMKRLSYVMVLFLLLTIATMVWLTVQASAWEWDLVQLAPTVVLAFVLWGVAMFAAVWIDRIKKQHDLVTYHEILAYWNGEAVDRDTVRGRRVRLMPARIRRIRVVVTTVLAALVGAFVGYGVAMLADYLLG